MLHTVLFTRYLLQFQIQIRILSTSSSETPSPGRVEARVMIPPTDWYPFRQLEMISGSRETRGRSCPGIECEYIQAKPVVYFFQNTHQLSMNSLMACSGRTLSSPGG